MSCAGYLLIVEVFAPDVYEVEFTDNERRTYAAQPMKVCAGHLLHRQIYEGKHFSE